MTEQTASAAGLVTEPAKAPPAASPAPAHNPADPAVKLDPAKVAPEAAKKAKRKRKPKSAAAKQRAADARKAQAATAKGAAAGQARAAAASSEELSAAYASATAHQVAGFADLPEKAELHVRLANGSEFVEGDIAASHADFVAGGQGVTFAKPIEIGPGGGPVRVTEVWVVADSGEAVKCDVGPLVGGNGYHAQIPALHLKF